MRIISNKFVKFDNYIKNIEFFRKSLIGAYITGMIYLIIREFKNFYFYNDKNV